MITVRVLFFASQRDIAGQREAAMTLPVDATVANLWEKIVTQYPRMAGYTGRVLFAVNQEFGTPTTVLRDGDEVAFIPPVSGG